MIRLRSIFGSFDYELIDRQTDRATGLSDADMDALMLKERHAVRLGDALAMADADAERIAELRRDRA